MSKIIDIRGIGSCNGVYNNWCIRLLVPVSHLCPQTRELFQTTIMENNILLSPPQKKIFHQEIENIYTTRICVYQMRIFIRLCNVCRRNGYCNFLLRPDRVKTSHIYNTV